MFSSLFSVTDIYIYIFFLGLNENCDTVVTSNNVIQDGAEYLVLNSMDVEPGSSYWKNGNSDRLF